jgi:4'-phosphopantetheinyl transferase EntD
VIEELLPAAVASAEAFADPPEVYLFPEEEAAVARAVEKRRREFATVRQCARTALGQLGLPPVPIVPGQRGAPRWPGGVVGSMTHCDGYRAAIVGHARDLVTLGVDAEPHEPLPGDVLDLVALPAERDHLASLTSTAPRVHWDRVLFCAKETIYKAWFPLTNRWLNFDEARVWLRPEGRFTADLLVPGPVIDGRQWRGFEGRFLVRDGVIVTVIATARTTMA